MYSQGRDFARSTAGVISVGGELLQATQLFYFPCKFETPALQPFSIFFISLFLYLTTVAPSVCIDWSAGVRAKKYIITNLKPTLNYFNRNKTSSIHVHKKDTINSLKFLS